MAQTQRPTLSSFSFIVIFFFFTGLAPFSLQVSASAYTRFQLLSKEKAQPATTTDTTNSSVLSVSLYPYSFIVKQPYKNYSDVVLSHLEADKARAKFINAKLHHALSKSKVNRSDLKTDIQTEDLETQLIGSNPTGTYLVRIGVGNQEFYLIPDTGSSINWLQCQPCVPCFKQSDPIFNPFASSSYRPLSCDSQQCTSLPLEERRCNNGDTCIFVASYGDSSASTGEYATETLSFGASGSVDNVAIGCGRVSQSRNGFGGAAGILGLGLTAASLPSQIEATSFSYCLVDRNSGSVSTLEFNSAPPSDSVVVPFTFNEEIDYYYVELTAIIVDEEEVATQIPASVYQIGQDGAGGIILDSGTTVTQFPAEVYNSLRDTFVKHTRNLPPPSGFSGFDTCYDLSSAPNGSVPKLSFQFSGHKMVPLKKENYLIRVDDSGNKFCLAFQVTSQPVSIIGNIQLQGMRVTYDLANNLIGFSPDKC